jgi:hypothetical protein
MTLVKSLHRRKILYLMKLKSFHLYRDLTQPEERRSSIRKKHISIQAIFHTTFPQKIFTILGREACGVWESDRRYAGGAEDRERPSGTQQQAKSRDHHLPVWSDVSLMSNLYQVKKYHPAFKTFSNLFHRSLTFSDYPRNNLKNVFGRGAVGGLRDASFNN